MDGEGAGPEPRLVLSLLLGVFLLILLFHKFQNLEEADFHAVGAEDQEQLKLFAVCHLFLSVYHCFPFGAPFISERGYIVPNS